MVTELGVAVVDEEPPPPPPQAARRIALLAASAKGKNLVDMKRSLESPG
jgi:hypothetical protein